MTLLNNMPTSIDVKLSNKHLALDLVRYTSGGISRADLARQLGLSRAAMSSIVGDFLRLEMTRESENSPTNRGRRPVLLEINPNFGYVEWESVASNLLSH